MKNIHTRGGKKKCHPYDLLATANLVKILHGTEGTIGVITNPFFFLIAWVALSRIFTSILGDPHLRSTYLIIDALDECTTDLSLLLNPKAMIL